MGYYVYQFNGGFANPLDRGAAPTRPTVAALNRMDSSPWEFTVGKITEIIHRDNNVPLAGVRWEGASATTGNPTARTAVNDHIEIGRAHV